MVTGILIGFALFFVIGLIIRFELFRRVFLAVACFGEASLIGLGHTPAGLELQGLLMLAGLGFLVENFLSE